MPKAQSTGGALGLRTNRFIKAEASPAANQPCVVRAFAPVDRPQNEGQAQGRRPTGNYDLTNLFRLNANVPQR
jgi:hypothetical protein